MDKRDKQEIIERYTERFQRLGAGAEALGSGSEEHQAIRYRVLSEVGDLGGQKVLDVGCGFGGFYDYCRHMQQPMSYTGIDIVPALIEKASKLHPLAEFKEMDILNAPDDWEMDYVVSSQAFNNRLEYGDNWELVQKVLAKCFKIARKGVAFDLMSTHVDFKEDRLYYFDPSIVLEFCKSLTRRILLRHDYPLFEFCIYLYPDFTGWRAESDERR